MSSQTCWLIFTLLIPDLLATQECPANFCEEQVKFWLATTNQDGKWMAEAGLEHPKEAATRGWKLLVDKEAASCDGEKYCRIVATLSGHCPGLVRDGYTTTLQGRYKLHLDKKTWEEAKKICETEGGHLAVLETKEEMESVKKFFESGNYLSYAFIGASDQAEEGTFVDIFGKPLVPFWKDKEPNDSGKKEDCVAIYSNGLYNDINCASKLNYLCEKNYM